MQNVTIWYMYHALYSAFIVVCDLLSSNIVSWQLKHTIELEKFMNEI